MQQISSLFPTFTLEKSKITNERQSVIKMFVDKLNAQRVSEGYKPLTARFVAIKLSHMSISDLYYFHSVCNNSNNFGRMFFGLLKVKK